MRIRFLFIFLALATSLQAQSLAHERESRLGTGINFTNWLEAYWMGSAYPQAAKYQKQDLLEMKAAGMKTIRLPVTFQLFTDTLPPYTLNLNHAAMAWVDSVISWAAEEDMYLIICNQHGWDLTNDNFQNKLPRMTAVWKQLVQHWATLDPDRYFFEILNEPPLGMLPANVETLMQTCIDSIRSLDQSHTLIIDAHSATLGWALATTTPYADTNLIYTWHTYDPYYFTHQGFSWAEPFPLPTGTPFPFLGDDQTLIQIFQQAADWRDQNGLPVFLGELGVGIHANPTSRCNWISLAGSLIDQYDFNWLYWDWGGVLPSDFDIFAGQGAAAENCIPCFRDALHLYPQTAADANTLNKYALSLFPNPAQEQVQLRFFKPIKSSFSVRLRDLQGALMWEKNFSSRAAWEVIEIPLSGLASGMYALHIQGNQSINFAFKFVKQ